MVSHCAQVVKAVQKIVGSFNWKGAVGISVTRQARAPYQCSDVVSVRLPLAV